MNLHLVSSAEEFIQWSLAYQIDDSVGRYTYIEEVLSVFGSDAGANDVDCWIYKNIAWLKDFADIQVNQRLDTIIISFAGYTWKIFESDFIYQDMLQVIKDLNV